MDILSALYTSFNLGNQGGGPVALTLEDATRLIANSQKGEKIVSLADFVIQEKSKKLITLIQT